MGMAYHVELHAYGTPLWLYQGCQIGHFAAKFLKFGRISSWLVVRFLGWPLGFFWPFCRKYFLLAVFENVSIF